MQFAAKYLNLFEILLVEVLQATNWGANETTSSKND